MRLKGAVATLVFIMLLRHRHTFALFYPLVLWLAIGIGLVGCASGPRFVDSGASPKNDPAGWKFEQAPTSAASTPASTLPGIPIRLGHKGVQKWINYFTGRGRRYMHRYLERSQRYLGPMKKILREEGLPEDLVYLQFVESGFSSHAHSPAAAVGYWQFIRGTARRYALRVDSYVDERRDPVQSTRAAAQYFSYLYNMFGDWYLAMAAYNWGEGRVRRMVRKYNSKDYFAMARRRKMPRETREYVPKFMAAIEIAHHPKKYGFNNLNYQAPLSFDVVEVMEPISLHTWAKKLDVKYAEIKKLNPKYRTDYVPVGKGEIVELRVPQGMKEQGALALKDSRARKPRILAQGTWRYRIRRGDNLSTLARRYGTSVRKLLALNNMSKRSILRVGRHLRIPYRGGTRYVVAQQNARSREVLSSGNSTKHRVYRGETLSGIARRHKTTVAALQRVNALGRSTTIRVGQILKVPNRVTAPAVVHASGSTHRVRRGDTLYDLARRYRTSVQALRKANNLGRVSLIRAGQSLNIPGRRVLQSASTKKVHRVRKGDTISHVATRYGVSLWDILRLNNLRKSSVIFPGQVLRIR